MIRMSRLTDYGVALMSYFARESPAGSRSARQAAQALGLPLPTASKILKILARGGLLLARRGARGGFGLARPPERTSLADVIAALEGPIAFTDCVESTAACSRGPVCPLRSNWRKINRAVLAAFRQLSLADMARPMACISARFVVDAAAPAAPARAGTTAP